MQRLQQISGMIYILTGSPKVYMEIWRAPLEAKLNLQGQRGQPKVLSLPKYMRPALECVRLATVLRLPTSGGILKSWVRTVSVFGQWILKAKSKNDVIKTKLQLKWSLFIAIFALSILNKSHSLIRKRKPRDLVKWGPGKIIRLLNIALDTGVSSSCLAKDGIKLMLLLAGSTTAMVYSTRTGELFNQQKDVVMCVIFRDEAAFRGRPLPVNASYIQVVVLTSPPHKILPICTPPCHHGLLCHKLGTRD